MGRAHRLSMIPFLSLVLSLLSRVKSRQGDQSLEGDADRDNDIYMHIEWRVLSLLPVLMLLMLSIFVLVCIGVATPRILRGKEKEDEWCIAKRKITIKQNLW